LGRVPGLVGINNWGMAAMAYLARIYLLNATIMHPTKMKQQQAIIVYVLGPGISVPFASISV
jgi:hypothetical protein